MVSNLQATKKKFNLSISVLPKNFFSRRLFIANSFFQDSFLKIFAC